MVNDTMAEQLLAGVANCKAGIGDWESTYKACKKGLEIYPDNYTMLYYYAIYHARKAQYKIGIEYMIKAFERGYPESKFALGQLAQMYQFSGDNAMAKRVTEMANKYKE